ncbi:tetratricopeptide repeat [Fusarium beomiforme]|uniref:Tetratricopeptide repeat n=1 Tax=Fusarium beomiforme TaxID=44412 RepID=A0A9P5A552_9HYPO|nr:tetratricopeptide repeat [Fusarium beomiforme]
MDIQQLESIKSTIRIYRWYGHFLEGTKFIDSLPIETKSIRVIAIEAAQLYLVQGQYKLANLICNDTSGSIFDCLDDNDQPQSIWNEEIAAYELMRAFILIGRYSKLTSALKITQRVGDAWQLGADEETASGEAAVTIETSGHDNSSLLLKQVQALTIHEAKRSTSFSEYKVLMKFYYWKTLVVAAEQGLLEEKLTKATAAKQIGTLRRILQSEGRLREARFLLYFEVNVMADARAALQELEEFLLAAADERWNVERALTLADIFEFRLKSEDEAVVAKAEEAFQQAHELFERISHGFGNIDLDLLRLSYSHDMSAGEKFVAMTKIADRYFQADHYQKGIRCLVFAISPEMIIDVYYEHVVNALELLQRKIDEAGSEILKQLSLIHSIGQACLKAPEYGFALQSLESYYANVPAEIGPKYHSLMSSLLANVYSTFGEHEKSLRAATEGLEIAKSIISYRDQSDAAFQVGVCAFRVSELHPKGSKEAIEAIKSGIGLMKEWVERDAQEGYRDGEVQKCLQIAEWENMRALFHLESSQISTSPAEQPWIERAKRCLPDSADALARSKIVDLETRMLIRQGKYAESLQISVDHLDGLKESTSIHPITEAQAYLRSAIQARLQAQNAFQRGQELAPEMAQSAVKLVFTALQFSYEALELYRKTHGAELILYCTLFVWDMINLITQDKPDASGQALLTAFMDELRRTEEVCDEMRRSVVPIGRLQSLMNKRSIVSKQANLRLYGVGVALSLQLDDPSTAWLWLQKGKARAFADSLGANVLIPEELLNRVGNDQVACELLKREQGVLDGLQDPLVNFVVSARKLASLRKEMTENALLSEITKLRDGILDVELGAKQLRDSLSKFGLASEHVKFVDWYVPLSTDGAKGPIVLFVRHLDGRTQAKRLSVSASEVKDWVSRAFTYPDMAAPPLSKKTGNRFLSSINGLVEGLSELTCEGDLLILSPSGPLNNVPLHALSAGGEALVIRNLVVYSSSIATMGQCLVRAHSRERLSPQGEPTGRSSPDTYPARFFAVYEEPQKVSERDLIFSHIKKLASEYPGEVSLGPDVTRSHFLQQCSNTRWVHYHGHARYAKDDVLKSALVLSDGRDVFASDHDGDEVQSGTELLNVSELFNAELPLGGVHFTIIACDSATQEIAPGDEPLGIIPALVYAGATSVLGCIWPIDSRAGRAFSDNFYKELALGRGECGGSGDEVVQLVQALRSTVLKMKKGHLGMEFRQPYYWASFALYGLWYFLR